MTTRTRSYLDLRSADQTQASPHRTTDESNTLGKAIVSEVLKYAFAGAIAGMVAWAGISARQSVTESKIEILASRAAEDRAAFTIAVQTLNNQLVTLNSTIQNLAMQQIRMEEDRRNRR
jgi:hypothetical protein